MQSRLEKDQTLNNKEYLVSFNFILQLPAVQSVILLVTEVCPLSYVTVSCQHTKLLVSYIVESLIYTSFDATFFAMSSLKSRLLN